MENMKKKYIASIMVLAATMTFGLVSCVEDEGTYELSPINEISISGIDEEYTKKSYVETLSIEPVLEGSLSGKDEDQLEYKWFFSSSSGTSFTHTLISTDRNLNFPVDVAPGTYTLYFQVKDKSTGLKWDTYTYLKARSQFVRGFYLFGDKADGTCGMDFVSMMDGRDTTVVKDIFVNSQKIKHAKNLIFTGGYDDNTTDLWAITEESSYGIEHSAALSSFDIIDGVTAETMIYPTIPVTHPLKMMEIHPHAWGASNMNLSKSSRIFMTENEFFISALTNSLEAYGNPLNRYSASTNELFKPSVYLFYPGNASYISRIMIFDETNHCFTGMNSSYSFAGYCKKYATDSGELFYFDQTKYTPVRTLVYGENGYGNAGRSYALMTDADGKFYIYGFSTSAATPSKYYGGEVDQSIATDFGKASHYAFFSEQSIILYSVGSQLWAYDYNRKDAKMVKDFGADITYLAMDYHSNNTSTDFIVATYNASEKGIVRKFTIADDQNKIEVTPHEKEVWNTDLKVVKVEYRNSSL